MTPQQEKAMYSASRIDDANLRARVVMLILADNTQGLWDLRDELITTQADIYRLCLASVLQVYKNGRGAHEPDHPPTARAHDGV
jgi:hypothetical protein